MRQKFFFIFMPKYFASQRILQSQFRSLKQLKLNIALHLDWQVHILYIKPEYAD